MSWQVDRPVWQLHASQKTNLLKSVPITVTNTQQKLYKQ